MSVQEREYFFAQVESTSKSSPASIFTIPDSLIPTYEEGAASIGLHTRVLPVVPPKLLSRPGKETGHEEACSWLILGKDERAVQALYIALSKESQEGRREGQEKGKTSVLTAAAGGAVVGAVGMFTGLAFT